MPGGRRCQLCNHPRREEIERYIRDTAEQTGQPPIRPTCRKFDLTTRQVGNHIERHMVFTRLDHKRLDTAIDDAGLAETDDYTQGAKPLNPVDEIEIAIRTCKTTLRMAIKRNQLHLVAPNARLVVQASAVLWRIRGTGDMVGSDIALSPAWQKMLDKIVTAIQDHPVALNAFIEAVSDIESLD